MIRIALVAVLAFFCLHSKAIAQSTPPDLVLDGKVTGVQNKTYFEVPFEVPRGVHRISVDFSYTGKDHKTTLDLGIADPERFRGNSGGNKSHFTISDTDATPSYLPGAIPPGKWRLLISVPNIRSAEQSEYRAEVRFNSKLEDASFASAPLSMGTRWYRGDLHMHTANSDGNCASQSGKRVPCPLFLTAQAAASRGLDFIAITDHNTESHNDSMRELQPWFDRLLLIPGREITTFWGHFNIFGITDYVDYRVVASDGRNVNAIVGDVRDRGGIASVNHAYAPGGELCMGCAWEPPDPVDMSLFTGVQVINGGNLLSSADFCDRQLAKGIRLTAIGGSDNHNALIPEGGPSAIGRPTTVVEAGELSVPAILEGIRRGRVFVDLTSSHDKAIDIEARARGHDKWTVMGDALNAASRDSVSLRIHLIACPHSRVYLLLDGQKSPELLPQPAPLGNETLNFSWSSDGRYHWLRCDVRDEKGGLMLLSNPVYINFANN